MDALPRRGFPWKVVVLLALGLLAAAGAVFVGVRSAANRKWARLEQRTEDLFQQWEARPGRRLPLWGPPTPGNAWDDYLAAISAAAKLTDADRQTLVDADLDRVRPLLSRHVETLSLLSKGAHREEARYRYPEQLRAMRIAPQNLYHDGERLSMLVRSKVRLLRQEGRPRDAAELLLDLAMFGRDMACRSFETDQQNGGTVMNAAFRDLRNCGPADAKDLEQRLSDFEALWPLAAWSRDASLLSLGWLFQQEDQTGEPAVVYVREKRSRREWRHFFSSRLQAADGFFAGDAWVRRASATDGLPWPQAWSVLEGLTREQETHRDPVVRDQFELTGSMWIRESQAAARLLRMALRFRATGEVLELDDPFGGKLQSTVTGGHLHAWSRGPFPARPESPEPTGSHREDLQVEVDR